MNNLCETKFQSERTLLLLHQYYVKGTRDRVKLMVIDCDQCDLFQEFVINVEPTFNL